MNNIDFYTSCGKDDAEDWIKSINNDLIIPSDLNLDDAQTAADKYFNKNFGCDGEYLLGDDKTEIRDLYRKVFTRRATLYLKELRKDREKKEEELFHQREKYFNLGQKEASKWYAAIVDSSFLNELDSEAIKKVASITCDSLFEGLDKVLKNYFVFSFVKTSEELLGTNE